MPDIDMDFDERRRDEVIRYATETYGSDRVAQIVTFQTIKGKQGIRDAARVLGFPPIVGDRLCKMYPPAMMGRGAQIDRALEISPELREAYEREPEAKEIIETARALEGVRREDSVHAAVVVIGDAPLVEYLPLKLTKDSREGSKKMVTQFDMNGVAQLWLLKMDFLGLRTLSVIEETLRHLRSRGIELDIDHIPLDDAETYAMLRRGDTTGVFQMESPGMRTLIKLLEPDRFEDLMALVALYRPGPLNTGMHTEFAERKHGRRKVVYPHPALEPVLKDTYGVMVYQEQIMQIAVRMAGYSMGQADTLRKVMAKKKRELVGQERERFVAGGVVQAILDARRSGGSFESFADLCRRVDPGALTKRVLESLIFAGSFDSFGYTRGGMVQQIGEQAAWEKVAAPILAERKAQAAGQFSLFGAGTDGAGLGEIDEGILAGDELDKRLLLSKEKEMLGQFVTDHPLLGVEDELRAQTSHPIDEMPNLGDGDLVTVGGIIGSLARKYTKRGEPYAQFRLEGLAGGVEVIAFPSVYEAVPQLIQPDTIVLVTGRIDLRGRELQIRATEVKEPTLGPDAPRLRAESLVVDLAATACTPAVLEKLKELFQAHPGAAPVRLRFLSSAGVTPLSVGSYNVDAAGSLAGELHG